MQHSFRVIVSIDGGGGRGVIALKLLSYLRKILKKSHPELEIPDWVDVFAGSSTGSIISGALMMRNPSGNALHLPEEMLNLYKYRGEQIFARNNKSDSNNTNYPLGFVLEKYFGDTILNDLDKHFIFTSYDLNSDSPFYFKDDQDLFRSLSLAKMMKACCAYPGVFPPLKIGSLLLADGLLAEVNPSLLAYKYARIFYPDEPIVLISIGTGTSEGNESDILVRESQVVHDNVKKLTEKDNHLLYYRFQPKLLNASKDINDASQKNIEAILKDVDQYITTNKQLIDELCNVLLQKSEALLG